MFVRIVYVIKDSGIKIMPIMLGRKQNAYLRRELYNMQDQLIYAKNLTIISFELNSHEKTFCNENAPFAQIRVMK